ncbi:hypothetical protein CE91St58_08870 [Lachnospiraceae bacterium]|nr:hypothetical protein CE91St58_08870 [Lachnospiraceae bacterium]
MRVTVPVSPVPSCLSLRPFSGSLPLSKVPVRARSRSDKYAAVLRLHRTQPKDRRIYTALTGILAERQAA